MIAKSFYEANNTLPKSEKDIKTMDLISLLNTDSKILSKIKKIKSNNVFKKLIHHDQVENGGWFHIRKPK